jgi:hypothetical protein
MKKAIVFSIREVLIYRRLTNYLSLRPKVRDVNTELKVP